MQDNKPTPFTLPQIKQLMLQVRQVPLLYAIFSMATLSLLRMLPNARACARMLLSCWRLSLTYINTGSYTETSRYDHVMYAHATWHLCTRRTHAERDT